MGMEAVAEFRTDIGRLLNQLRAKLISTGLPLSMMGKG